MQQYMMARVAQEATNRGLLALTQFRFGNAGSIYIKSADGASTFNVIGFQFSDAYVTLTKEGAADFPTISYADDKQMATWLPVIFRNCPQKVAK